MAVVLAHLFPIPSLLLQRSVLVSLHTISVSQRVFETKKKKGNWIVSWISMTFIYLPLIRRTQIWNDRNFIWFWLSSSLAKFIGERTFALSIRCSSKPNIFCTWSLGDYGLVRSAGTRVHLGMGWWLSLPPAVGPWGSAQRRGCARSLSVLPWHCRLVHYLLKTSGEGKSKKKAPCPASLDGSRYYPSHMQGKFS